MDPNNPLSFFVGAGIVGMIVSALLIIVGFLLSAFITSLWLRLVLAFMRGRLDYEYARMRGAGSAPGTSLVREPGPRDWTGGQL